MATVLAAATVATGWIVTAFGGSVGRHAAPFYVEWAPAVSWYTAPALGLLGLGIFAAGRLRAKAVTPIWFASAALGVTVVVRLALNMARVGPSEWYGIFGGAWDAKYEYLPGLPALRLGVGAFLDRFAQFSGSLPIHPSAHPPGTLLTLHALGIHTAKPMAALTIGIGALSAPLTYLLGRRLLDEGRARVATLFYVFAPSSMLYGATSVDALYATLGAAAATALLGRRRLIAAAGTGLLALASFFSYALAGVGAWAVLVTARRRGLLAAVGLGAGCAAVLVGAYAVLWAASGFDVLGSLAAAHGAYVRGISMERPYWYWVFGSPTAFFLALGLPLAWLAMRGAGRGEPAALALVIVVAAAAILGFTKAENERIWQFLVPLACVAAAAQHRRSTTVVLVALVAQAVAVELTLNTHW